MSSLTDLKTRLQSTKNFYLTKNGELENIKKEIKLKEDTLSDLNKENEKLNIEKKLIENACSEAREQGRQFLEEISTLAISSVFQDDTKVKLILDEKGNNPILDVKVSQLDENNEEQYINPNYDGGGLNDVLSLGFLISIASTIDNNFAPYILDEPSKYVSKGNLATNFADYMKEVSQFTNKQIIMSTHDEAMLDIGQTRYKISKNPTTKISEVTKEL